jgi:hypothetical protein
MPAKSKQQFKFMKAVEGGYIHPDGLSKEKAEKFTSGVHPSKLSKFSRINKIVKRNK